MKIVWICHFSTSEIQSILHPSKTSGEFAPWISQLARLFEKDTKIELHIVAPHGNFVGIKHFVLRNIHYHFFNPCITLFNKNITSYKNIDLRTNFLYNNLLVRIIINKIKPDLIHLHGAENAYYSASILQFRNKYPVLVTIQGFISHTTDSLNSTTIKRIAVEKEVITRFRHFAYRTKPMGEEVLKFNKNAVLHWHYYPVYEIKPIPIEKKFDVVFFAKLCKDKGIEDLLQALSIVKNDHPSVNACLIGSANPGYLEFLKSMAENLGISSNLFWAGFQSTQADVHKMASSARISVLPTYHDVIPGTIVESMFLKLPVVSYAVGGIPEINVGGEFVSLVEKGDVVNLAAKISWLLSHPGSIEKQGQMAYTRITEMLDERKIPVDLHKAYRSVIEDFKKQ